MGKWQTAPWFDGHTVVDPCVECNGAAYVLAPNHHNHCDGWSCEKLGCPIAQEEPCPRCRGGGEEPEQLQEVLL